MRVLIACEFSGIVRDAFRSFGHYAVSCDLLPTELPGLHIQDDVLYYLNCNWDLMIAHPPCTYLCVSGARWFKERKEEQENAIEFVQKLMSAPIPKIAIENPIGVLSSRIRKPDQIVQPWMFGHGETKATCFWLKGIYPLLPMKIVEGRENRIHELGPSSTRGKERSITYHGIADAMALQWGR